MAIYRKRNEKWEYRIRYPFTQARREKMKGGLKQKKEAQIAAIEMETFRNRLAP